MEYQRQQLAYDIQMIREKRVVTINPAPRPPVNESAGRPTIGERSAVTRPEMGQMGVVQKAIRGFAVPESTEREFKLKTTAPK